MSLGYFQKVADRGRHPASMSVDVVRRQSGGGAILHDQELTYSLVLPCSLPLSKNTSQLYEAVHGTIALVLNEAVTPAHRFLLCAQDIPRREERFLCFDRRSRGDILCSKSFQLLQPVLENKVVGSAQRRFRGAVLQHGSILLKHSRWATHLLGIQDVCEFPHTAESLCRALVGRVSAALGLNCIEFNLENDFQRKIQALSDERYRNAVWTERR